MTAACAVVRILRFRSAFCGRSDAVAAVAISVANSTIATSRLGGSEPVFQRTRNPLSDLCASQSLVERRLPLGPCRADTLASRMLGIASVQQRVEASQLESTIR